MMSAPWTSARIPHPLLNATHRSYQKSETLSTYQDNQPSVLIELDRGSDGSVQHSALPEPYERVRTCPKILVPATSGGRNGRQVKSHIHYILSPCNANLLILL
jgi:hypothetical protein